MRKYSKTIGALAAASTFVAGNAMAELEGEVSVGYTNMYEFRFFDVGNDLISGGVDLAYDTGGPVSLSAGAWYGTWDTPGAFGNGTLGAFNNDELDLYGAVSFDVAGLDVSVGYIYYYFPDQSFVASGGNTNASQTQEVYLGVSYEFDFGLSLASTYYYDFVANNGAYVDANVGYAFELNECLALELGAGVAWADGHGLQARSAARGGTGTKDGFQGYYLTAALPWEFREGVTLTPYAKYTAAESDLATDGNGTGGQDFFVAGVSLAVGF